MGIEYAQYLIAEDNTFKPSPEKLSRLVSALFDTNCVPDASSSAFKRMVLNGAFFHADAEQTGRQG